MRGFDHFNFNLRTDIRRRADLFVRENETRSDDGLVVVNMFSHISKSSEPAEDKPSSRSGKGHTLPLLAPAPTCV
jgi:hypothetical protein